MRIKPVDPEEVCQLYLAYGSIKQVAQELGVSNSRVRKILINYGLFENEYSQKITELRERGLTQEEIAERLHLHPNTVNAYSPYEKGQYGKKNATKNALKLRAWREKKEDDNDD